MIFRRKDTVTTHAAINANGATRVDARLRMPHGTLKVSGGATPVSYTHLTLPTKRIV